MLYELNHALICSDHQLVMEQCEVVSSHSMRPEIESQSLAMECSSEHMPCNEVITGFNEKKTSGLGQVLREKDIQLNTEKEKIEKAVRNLTLDNSYAIDHQSVLQQTAKILDKRRRKSSNFSTEETVLDKIRKEFQSAKSFKDMVCILTKYSFFQERMTTLVHSRMFEQLLGLSSSMNNPLSEFPMNVNKNHYSDIVEFALKNAPDVLDLVLKLCVKNEDPVLEKNVVQCAQLFSSLACTVSRKNNALKKTKSLSVKKCGITNDGMDILSEVGLFQSSRQFRNDRLFLASVFESVLQGYA